MSLMRKKMWEMHYRATLKQATEARNNIAQQRANTLAAGGMTAQQAWDYAKGTQAAQDEAASAFLKKAEFLKQNAAKKGIKLGD